jgi:hypothetical protein
MSAFIEEWKYKTLYWEGGGGGTINCTTCPFASFGTILLSASEMQEKDWFHQALTDKA